MKRLTKFSIIYLLGFIIIFPCFAQTPIKGRVIDSADQKAISEVHILALPGGEGAVSDKDGNFQLISDSSIKQLSFTHISYKALTVSLSDTTSNLAVSLQVQPNQLNEFVAGFETNKTLHFTPASVAVVGQQELERYNNTSLLPAVNTVPGVRMEERSPGSYRFSIRGSLIRSPFGVRNIKVYWNEIPFTDPTGNTQLNLLDYHSIGRIEIIKGLAGSIYGAGTGGVVKLESKRPAEGEKSFMINGIAGSFGLKGWNLAGGAATENVSTMVNYSSLQSDGYREQSAMNRQMFNWHSKVSVKPGYSISIKGFYSDLFYQIPGGIDEKAFMTDPKASRPGSIEQNSSINLETFNLGVSQEYRVKGFSNISSLYAVNTAFDHPFIFDYKRSAEQGWGGRFVSSYIIVDKEIRIKASGGIEFQKGFTAAKNYDNNAGIPGLLRLDDEITSEQYILFTQLEAELPRATFATLGVSYNRLKYDILRLSSFPTAIDYRLRRNFLPVFSPRFALLKEVSGNVVIHGSISYGFSPPTVTEIRTSDGALNEALRPETGINYETGFRGTLFKNRMDFDITIFSMQVNNTIVSHTSSNGVVLFKNSGNTLQNGVEFMMNFKLVQNASGFVKNINLKGSYTYNHFRFRDYIMDGSDFSGNQLTGVAPHVLVMSSNFETQHGFYLNSTAFYSDRTPLNDANTVFADDFINITGRFGFRRSFKRVRVDVFGGVDNLLDQQFSLGNDLNAFGGRFYQAATGIGFFGGVGVKYLFKRKGNV